MAYEQDALPKLGGGGGSNHLGIGGTAFEAQEEPKGEILGE